MVCKIDCANLCESPKDILLDQVEMFQSKFEIEQFGYNGNIVKNIGILNDPHYYIENNQLVYKEKLNEKDIKLPAEEQKEMLKKGIIKKINEENFEKKLDNYNSNYSAAKQYEYNYKKKFMTDYLKPDDVFEYHYDTAKLDGSDFKHNSDLKYDFKIEKYEKNKIKKKITRLDILDLDD